MKQSVFLKTFFTICVRQYEIFYSLMCFKLPTQIICRDCDTLENTHVNMFKLVKEKLQRTPFVVSQTHLARFTVLQN